jgi:hypothetical protein
VADQVAACASIPPTNSLESFANLHGISQSLVMISEDKITAKWCGQSLKDWLDVF